MKPVTMLAAFAAILVGVVTGMRLASTHEAPTTSLHAFGANSGALTADEVEKLLAEHYEDIRHVNQIPSAIKQSFTNVTGLPFDMNNPGDPISTDYIIPGVPTRQLVFAGVSDDSAFIVYKQGGFADRCGVTVFSALAGGSAWWAYLFGGPPKDIASLQKILQESKFEIQKKNK